MKAFIHTGTKTWEVDGQDWTVAMSGDVATLWRHKPGGQHNDTEPAAVIQIQGGAYILFGDDHPAER